MKIKAVLLILALNALLLPPALADFQRGLDAARLGQHLLALKEWQPLAAEGHPPSQYNLGLMYLHGLGLPLNTDQALVWFKKSAAQGYVPAQQILATRQTNN